MAAFCTCCGEVITAKSVTCMACGAPAHGMTMKTTKVSASAGNKAATVEALPLPARLNDRPMPGCCVA